MQTSFEEKCSKMYSNKKIKIIFFGKNFKSLQKCQVVVSVTEPLAIKPLFQVLKRSINNIFQRLRVQLKCS